MPNVMFCQYFPEIAKMETRGIKIFDNSGTNLPAGDYGFPEMFCDGQGVIAGVFSSLSFPQYKGRKGSYYVWMGRQTVLCGLAQGR